MTVNKERVQLLVEALRSGKYPQTHNTLHRVRAGSSKRDASGYCCLGVACTIARDELHLDVVETSPDGRVAYDRSYGFMPPAVSGYYGFLKDDPLLLIPNPLPWYKRPFADAALALRGKYLTVTASDANDTFELNFLQIADAFERTYLKDNKYNKVINENNS